MSVSGEQIQTNGRTWIGRLSVIASVALASLLLAWPSIVNRGPFFIADTTAYLRSADAAFSSILSYDSIWSDKRDLYVGGTSTAGFDGTSQTRSSTALVHPPLIGRSIYYGAFVYFPVLWFQEYAGVLIQTTLSAIVVWIVLVPLAFERRRRRLVAYFGAIAILSLVSSLPFTATLLVPDYLTGLASASLIMLLCFWNKYAFGEIFVLASVIVLAAVSHTSNLPILLATSLIGLLLSKKCQLSAVAALIGLSAVVIGLAGEALYVSAVEHKTGMTPIRPPFVTARLIADGPGHKLLRAQCATEKFEVCRYAARTPRDSDIFLWSDGPEGVFSIADFASQNRLSEQDRRFALATFNKYPLLTTASSLEAAVKQLSLFDLRIWQGDAGGKPFIEMSNLPRPVAERMSQTLNVQGRMPVAMSEAVIMLVSVVSLVLAIWFLLHAWQSNDVKMRAIGAALALVIFAIVVNAAISGGLSKPDARYSLRIVWILPLFVYLFAGLWLRAGSDEDRQSRAGQNR